MSSEVDQRTWGRIGGLTAWSRNDAETMTGAAHRGFRAKFEALVDPDGRLDPRERATRADRARRAHMLTLAAKSVAARKKKAGPDRYSGPATPEVSNADARPATPGA